MMEFMMEIKYFGVPIDYSTVLMHRKYFENKSQVYYNAYKYKAALIERDKAPKMCPCKVHKNLKYHHFHEHICSGQIKIPAIGIKDQTVEILTNPLPSDNFILNRNFFLSW